jgi:pre-mRNA-splicing factor CWC26
MASGAAAGLMQADAIAADAKRLKKEQRRQLAAQEDSGKDTDTVIRDKRGRALTMLSSITNGGKGPTEEKFEWGSGKEITKTDTEEKEARRMYEMQEAAKPIARYADDADLNSRQAQVQRWGDPMAEMMAKKQKIRDNKSAVDGSKVVMNSRGLAHPNRFGIAPGPKWDGVDRSNGFEESYFKRMNERGATEVAAHKWSCSDM